MHKYGCNGRPGVTGECACERLGRETPTLEALARRAAHEIVEEMRAAGELPRVLAGPGNLWNPDEGDYS